MGLPTTWIRHLNGDAEAQASFEAAVRNSTTAISRLKEIIQEELDALDRAETSEAQFEQPNWEFKQSYRNGQRSKLRAFLALLTFDQEKE